MKMSPIKVLSILLLSSLFVSACEKEEDDLVSESVCNLTKKEVPISVTFDPSFQIEIADQIGDPGDNANLALKYTIKKTYCSGKVNGLYTRTINTFSGGFCSPGYYNTFKLENDKDIITITLQGGEFINGQYQVDYRRTWNYSALEQYDGQTINDIFTHQMTW